MTAPDSNLATLPIQRLAAKDSVMFLWATWPNLPVAFATMEAWDFEYKTLGFIWFKTNKNSGTAFTGGGFWTRANTEICLIGTRGNLRCINRDVHQIIETWEERDDLVLKAPHPRIINEEGKNKILHSAKPPEVRKRIVELMGDLPRIELFAREKADGYDVWGNEVESDIDMRLEN